MVAEFSETLLLCLPPSSSLFSTAKQHRAEIKFDEIYKEGLRVERVDDWARESDEPQETVLIRVLLDHHLQRKLDLETENRLHPPSATQTAI